MSTFLFFSVLIENLLIYILSNLYLIKYTSRKLKSKVNGSPSLYLFGLAKFQLAGAQGIEPWSLLLERSGLPLTYAPSPISSLLYAPCASGTIYNIFSIPIFFQAIFSCGYNNLPVCTENILILLNFH